MPRPMTETHEMGWHKERPRPRCPLCKAEAEQKDTRRQQFENVWDRLREIRDK